jgi:hypothetical protein
MSNGGKNARLNLPNIAYADGTRAQTHCLYLLYI